MLQRCLFLVAASALAGCATAPSLAPLLARTGAPCRQVGFGRLASVPDASKAGDVDFTITNATAAHAKDLGCGDPVVTLELGLLASQRSTLAAVDGLRGLAPEGAR